MNSVFVLFHVRSDDEYGDDAKLIGVYSTNENAKSAISRLLPQPGFRDHPSGFTIEEYRIDQDNWTEGFGFDRTP